MPQKAEMTGIVEYIRTLFSPRKSKNVALVLGGGGARGYAHIGAIEVLQEHGFHITSVAGTSMGALVGGLFAAGKLDTLKQTIHGLTKREILSLVDISIGFDHIATAEKLRQLLDKMTEGQNIEQLKIPFCCSASDMVSGKEHVFRTGPLSEAIRASISIPCLFSPVRTDGHVYVDGSVHNTLPLNRVQRQKGDILVAVNASAPVSMPQREHSKEEEEKKEQEQNRLMGWLKGRFPVMRQQFSDNYLRMALRVCQIAIQNNTAMAIDKTPPDILVDIPMDAFGLLDFSRGEEIIEYGRKEMERQLATYRNE